MTTLSMKFFMRPAEFAVHFASLAQHLDLTVILARIGSLYRLELAEKSASFVMGDGRSADSLYLASGQPDPSLVDLGDLRPGELGWVQVSLPREEGDVLFLAEMAAKSDWWDPDRRVVLENPAAHHLFRKLAPSFRKACTAGVWAYNILGGKAGYYRNIWYSSGTKDWADQGGELQQPNVANVRFVLTEPATE